MDEHRITIKGSFSDTFRKRIQDLDNIRIAAEGKFCSLLKLLQRSVPFKVKQLLQIDPFVFDAVYSFFEELGMIPNGDVIENIVESMKEAEGGRRGADTLSAVQCDSNALLEAAPRDPTIRSS